MVGEEEEEEEAKYRRRTCWGLAPPGWLSRWVGRALQGSGAVPGHVAFILDGNRRFAVRRGLERKSAGHALGFDTLHEALEWCHDAGVRTVTVFAFSIDNFRRPPEEVDTLMRLAEDKFDFLLSRSELVRRRGFVVRVWGDLSLLSPRLREAAARVTRETQHNRGPCLNVCLPYTSTNEVVLATRRLAASAGASGAGWDATVDEPAFEAALFGGGSCPHPQLLIRTSGESRLSDFLCWQTGSSVFLVYDCLWPEFSLLHFVAAVLRFRFELRRRRF